MGGTGSAEEELAQRAGVPFVGVPAGGVHGLAPWRAARNLVKLMQGVLAALRLAGRRRPQALFVTGGYASVPVALAAWLKRVPILVYLPDIEPGLAVRFIARLATRVALTTEQSRAFFPPHKSVVTGYPVRPELTLWERTAARGALGLEAERPVLLVYGGSHGARSINQATVRALTTLLEETQVVHVTGHLDWPWVAEQAGRLPAALRAAYHPFEYLHEMGAALAAADLAVSRAGASVLGELPAVGLPAVLVPYPHAWRYQRVNAEWLVSRGVAVLLTDERLEQELTPTVLGLLRDPERLTAMRRRMQALARPDAAQGLAAQLRSLVGKEEEGA